MLAYEYKIPVAYRSEFIAKVRQISSSLGIDPNWLMAIMNFESAGTFSPSVRSPKTGATGLIQFMPSTALSLGTTTAALANMDAIQQLDYVYKYYKPYAGKIKNYIDTYLVTFFPLAVGKGDNFLIKSATLPASLIAAQNPAFDTDGNMEIYVWEIKKIMLSKLPTEWINNFSIPLVAKAYKKELIYGAVAVAIGTTIVLYGKYARQAA